jgi:4'-phosphopantetheinyl transferase
LAAATGIPAVELQIKRSEKGKPEIPGFQSVHFNISHSGKWVVAAQSNMDVGIDIENIRAPQYRIAERFFSGTELKALNLLEGDEKRNYFFDLWTLKESYLKMLGKGLTQSLGSFTMKKSDDGFVLLQNGREDITTYFYQPSLDQDYKLSVCSRSPVFNRKVSLIKIDELLNQQGDGEQE